MFLDRRRLLLLALIAVMTFVGIKLIRPAITADTPSTPYLTVGVIGDKKDLKNLWPDGSVERIRYLPQSAAYESPVRWDSTRGIRPVLLSDWRFSKEGLSVELVFKKNVRFHNGKEMTALDVKRCWERTLRRAASGEVVGLFSQIAGTDEFLRGQGQDIYGIQAISANKLKVKLLKSPEYFISSLCHPAFWVYDSQDQTGLAPGTGPFVLKEVKGDTVRVEAFQQYHGDGPFISGIEFQCFSDDEMAVQAYRQGKLNLVDEVDPAAVKSLDDDSQLARQFLRQPLLAVYGMAFNMDKEPWSDNYLLRRALNYGIDRQAIVRDIFAGGALACSGPLPEGLKIGDKVRGYSYNPELAKQLLSEAGYPGGDGLPGITLYHLPDSGYRQIAESIAEQLGALGVEIYPRAINSKSMLSELNSRRFQSCLIGWQADYPEAYAFFGTIYNNGVTGYRHAQVSRLLQTIGTQPKPDRKNTEHLLKVYRLITEDAPMLWLCQPQTVKLVAPIVSGMDVNGLNQVYWNDLKYQSSL